MYIKEGKREDARAITQSVADRAGKNAILIWIEI